MIEVKKMKKAPLALLCFLFFGPTPPDENWSVLLLDGTEYSDVFLLRLEGESLVITMDEDTLYLPVSEVAEIFRSSHPLGIPGWLAGYIGGAALGAGCAAAAAPEARGRTEEGLKTGVIAGSAALGATVGAIVGCLGFPKEETRYVLRNKLPAEKKSIISSILT